MIAPLGTSLFAWIGLFLLGGLAGLVLGVTSQPQWRALPRFAPRARWLGEEGEHFAYGGIVALLGVLFVSLFESLLATSIVAIVYALLVLAGSWFGNIAPRRKAALIAHAKVLAGLLAIGFAGYYISNNLVIG